MFDLHMCIYNELVNLGPHWHSPMAPSWYVPTKHVSISMGDLGKPPRYKGSTNCRPYRGAQLVNSKGESVSHNPSSLHLKIWTNYCVFLKI
jgi:hypothetical protein